MYSGVGGQMDFMRGAALAREGRPIIALPSTAGDGSISRITAVVHEGAGIVTTRAHVRTVVTEYGVAELWGRSLRQRANALIAIAHPDHRDRLTSDARRLTERKATFWNPRGFVEPGRAHATRSTGIAHARRPRDDAEMMRTATLELRRPGALALRPARRGRAAGAGSGAAT
jgi:acyl-CoA hydrolase